jgi:hypothetical protein
MQEEIPANSKRAKPTYTVPGNSMEDSAASRDERPVCFVILATSEIPGSKNTD